MNTADRAEYSAPSVRLRPFTRAAYWLLPPLLCLAVFWPGLWVWFQADDFAWLSLRFNVHDWPSLMRALFAPMAQGSVRPLSERAFFLVLESAFGMHALPFRICVFLTQCANLTLLAAVTRRLTGSDAAGFWAAVFWLVNGNLIVVMAWSSAYNQVLCAFFLLGAFWFLLRYIRTGKISNYVWQWILFLLGFGALEVNVVYPALAAVYTFLLARRHFRATLPLFIPSAIFALADRMAAPAQVAGPYALHFDFAMPATLLTYWHWALVSDYASAILSPRLEVLLYAALTIVLLSFAVVRALGRDWLPVFCLAWFAIVLIPFLPLRDHISDYYLTVPTIGLAMLGAYALVLAWRQPLAWRVLAVAAMAAYTILMVRLDRTLTPWWDRRSWAVERMVLGVARAHQLHPDKAILLDDVDSALFWGGVFHHPFRLFGASNVYLTPGSGSHIEAHDATGSVSGFVLPASVAVHAAKSDQIVVYRVGSKSLKAITSAYEAAILARPGGDELPRKVDAGNPLMDYLLGAGWYPPEKGFRWMSRTAALKVGGPTSGAERLYIEGFPPVSPQPIVSLRVTVDGIPLPEAWIQPSQASFRLSFPLPNEAVGKKEMLIGLEAGRTFRSGADTRDLGLNFGTFEVR
jgi:hypothetical protein